MGACASGAACVTCPISCEVIGLWDMLKPHGEPKDTTMMRLQAVGCTGLVRSGCDAGSLAENGIDAFITFQLVDDKGGVHLQSTVSAASLEEASPGLVWELLQELPASQRDIKIGKDSLVRGPTVLRQLERLLDERMPGSVPLQRLLCVPRAETLWRVPARPSFQMLADCFSPLLSHVAAFAVSSPSELVRLCCLTSPSVAKQLRLVTRKLWEELYAQDFAAFHDCQKYLGTADWRSVYQRTLRGKVQCQLEVFDREQKLGFAMSAWPASVSYNAASRSFVARYFSASQVSPEPIPWSSGHRLRFCPESSRQRLQPGCGPREVLDPQELWKRYEHGIWKLPSTCLGHYPYRVLEGAPGLQPGMPVELQWKMQEGSPFGWWFGHLEVIQQHPGGTLTDATIVFRHFPSDSKWFRLSLTFGDSTLRPCQFGGFTGGVRPVLSEKEAQHWMRFFPAKPVVF